MKKIFALALVAVFCLAGYGVSAQTQSKNQKLSPKQEKREAREQRRAQRQAEYERYIDSLVTSGNFQFIPNSMRVMPAGSEHLITNPNFGLQYWDGEFDIFLPYVKGAVMPYYLTVLNYTISNPEETLKEQSPNGWEVTSSLRSSLRPGMSLRWILCQDRRCDADHHQFLEHYGAVFGYDHFAVTAVFG